MQAEISFKIITILGIIRSLKKISIASLDPQHLKVKDIELDISLIKNITSLSGYKKLAQFINSIFKYSRF